MLDRLRDESFRRARGQILACVAVLVFILGAWQYHDFLPHATGHTPTWWEVFYRSIQLFTLDFPINPDPGGIPLLLHILRFVAPILTVTSLLNAVGRASRDQTDRWFARRWRDHVVVCGASPLARLVVAELRHGGQRVVAVADAFPAGLVDEYRAAGARVVIASARSAALAEIVRGAERAIVAIVGDAETLRWATFISAVNDGPSQVDALVQHAGLVDLAADVGLGHIVVRSTGEWTANGAMVVMPPTRPPSGPLRIAVVSDLQESGELANAIWTGHVGLGEPAEIHLVEPIPTERLNLARPLRAGAVTMHDCSLDRASGAITLLEDDRLRSGTALSDPIYVWTSDAGASISTARSLRRDHPDRRVCVLSAQDDVIVSSGSTSSGDGNHPWLSFLGITDLAANGLLLERFGEGRLAACLYADHSRHANFPETDGPHTFGSAPQSAWRDLDSPARHRYLAAAAAIAQSLRQLGLTVDYDARGGSLHDPIERTTDLSPVELATVAGDIARSIDVPWPARCDGPADLLTRQPFVDLAARLPALVALSGGEVMRSVAPVNLDAGDIDSIARNLHEAYVLHRRLAGDADATSPSLKPWDELAERLRESNNEQARDISSKIAMLGGDLVVGDVSIGWPTDGQMLDALAEVEHRRWCRSLRDRGFRYAPQRSEAERTHPNLVPYEELIQQPGTPQVKDQGAMRDVPQLLAQTRYCVHIGT